MLSLFHKLRSAPRETALDAAMLEDRIMLSATPLVDLAVDSNQGSLPGELTDQTTATYDSVADSTAEPAGGEVLNEFRFNDTPTNGSERQVGPTEQAARLELVFVDTGTADYEQLVNDLLINADPTRELEVYLLDAHRDGIEQISDILAGYEGVDALHLVSHGTEGQIKLGNTWLSRDTLNTNGGAIAGWNDALQDGADVLIYGCDLASGDEGRALVEALGALCNCDVAASVDDTGFSAQGGDWDLEFTVGSIETAVPFSQDLQDNWLHLLATQTVGDNFSVSSYGNNDGSVSWAGNWIEDDSGNAGQNPGGGNIKIVGGRLTLKTQVTGDDIYREVDLSTAATATLTFDMNNLINGSGDTLRLEVSSDGGSSWTTLKDYTSGNRGAYAEAFDITPFVAVNSQIRFHVVAGVTNDAIDVDNLQIAYSDAAGNTPPTITSDGGGPTASVNVAENTAAVTTVTATDPGAPPQILTYSIIGGADAALFAIDGSTGALSFVSARDFETPTDAGADNVYEVAVQVCDGTLTDTQAITVSVTPVNDNMPVITSDGGGPTAAVNAAENTTAVTIVAATDADLPAQALTYSIVGGADAAKFSINGSSGALSFITAPDFEAPSDIGLDNVYDVTVQVSDGAGGVDSQAIAVAVINANETPTAANDAYGVNEDVMLVVMSPGVLGNDLDPDGDAMNAVLVTGTSNGSLVLNANGSFSYTPNADFNGIDNFTYRASDGSLSSNVATVAITVNPVNDAPVATDDSFSTLRSQPIEASAPGVLANDSDVDGDPLVAVLVSRPGNAKSFTFNADGSFSYTPDTNFKGTDNFTYRIDDGSGEMATATVTITVDDRVGPPVLPPEPPAPPASNDPPPDENKPPLSIEQPLTGAPPPIDPVPSIRPPKRDVSAIGTSVIATPELIGTIMTDGLEAKGVFDYQPLTTIERMTSHVLRPAMSEIVSRYVAAYDDGLLWNDLGELRKDMQSVAELPFFAAGSVAGATGALTVGYVLWTIRSGWLAASLLAQMPAWGLVDPLVVLDYLDDESSSSKAGGKHREEDDSLESMLDKEHEDSDPSTDGETREPQAAGPSAEAEPRSARNQGT